MPKAGTQSATVSYVAAEDTQDIGRYICNLWNVTEFDIHTERDDQKLTEIINFYQEQPHVLDPHLQSWIDKLLEVVLSDKISQIASNLGFKYLYLLTKVRGEKYIVRLFPHEVADIETVLKMLESDKIDVWQAKYVLFLWLSILVLIPFDLKRLDGEREEGWSIRRMLSIATSRIEGSDKSSEAAALVVAKLVTRPDLHTEHLQNTISFLISSCSKAENDVVFGSKQKLGMLTCLCRLYKLGRRDYLLPHSQHVLQQLGSLQLRENQNTLLRKFEIKLAQRIGLTFLAPRVAKWRYKRGTRVLADSFNKNAAQNGMSGIENSGAVEEEDDYEIPDEIEDVLEILFRGLRDLETIVRWSAAKGVGRITSRLPRSLATDVVNQLLECFSPLETSSSWHGGCLALAELGRHGFLLPEHLPEVVPILVRALQYDEKRGNLAIGANVRDAACYMSWSFARTYDPQQIKPFVNDIASALILTTLFDWHVGCRRAASAAFQENVGRQGSFPFGIDILTTCDYYAVALQTNTYQKLSVKVASYEPYSKPIIDHLARVKVGHWNPTIRRDAGVALGLLCSVLPGYISSDILPFLLDAMQSGDFNARHGSLHATSDICVGLKGRIDQIPEETVEKINGVLGVLETRNSFRGSGGDEMRSAVCYFIEKMSTAGVHLTDETIKCWQDFINVCIVNPEQYLGVQNSSVEALRAFSHHYYTSSNPAIWSHLVDYYSNRVRHEFTATRVGATLALSVLPTCVLAPHTLYLVKTLAPCTKVLSKAETSLAECRASAVKAITNVQLVCECNCETRVQIYRVLLECLEDYSTDSRGDIGSYVREAAMACLKKCNQYVMSKGHPTINLTLTREIKLDLVRGFLQQSVEKIDRTRQNALDALHHLVHSEVELVDHDLLKITVPHLQCLSIEDAPLIVDLGDIANTDNYKNFVLNADYFDPSALFCRSLVLIQSPEYIHSLMRGVVVSIGGLTESLVKASSTAYVDYLTEHEEHHRQICDVIIAIMTSDAKDDRVIIPLLKTVELTLTNIMLDDELGTEFAARFVERVKVEVRGCGSVVKLLTVLGPLVNCLQFSGNKSVLSQIMLLLCHRYPRVRKGMADAFYTALVTFDDAISNVEEVSGIIEETVWDDPNDMDSLRTKRNNICDLVGVKQPKLLTSSKPKTVTTTNEKFDSYSDLVGRAGY